MNEHDSERIAGVLAADGMEPTDDLAKADVVVFNTCCIRENVKKFLAENADLMIEISEKIKDASGLNDVDLTDEDEAEAGVDQDVDA